MKLRVRDHRFNEGARKVMLGHVQEILVEYSGNLPVTIRQIYYRLLGRFGDQLDDNDKPLYVKDTSKKKPLSIRLTGVLTDARESGVIDWDDIRDDGPVLTSIFFDAGVKEYLNKMRSWVATYKLDRQKGQEARILVCCESAGMVPQLERLCKPLGIKVHSSGGLNSVSTMMDLAEMLHEENVKYKILHLGDYDPAGVDVYNSLRKKVWLYLRGLNKKYRTQCPSPSFRRVAVRPEMVGDLHLITETKESSAQNARNWPGAIFVKASGKGERNETYLIEACQLESIPPDQINEILRQAIIKRFDEDVRKKVIDEEEKHKKELYEIFNKSIDPLLREEDEDDEEEEEEEEEEEKSSGKPIWRPL